VTIYSSIILAVLAIFIIFSALFFLRYRRFLP